MRACAAAAGMTGAALIGVALTAMPGAAAPAEDGAGSDALRVWTGPQGSTVGTAITAESCDFTGDGRPDLITSDWLWERAPFEDIGAVYVIPNGTESGQLDDPTTGITRIEGPQREGVSVGFRINCAGDVNGDGFDDVLVDEGDSSRVWVVFGTDRPENLSLEFLGDRGFVVERPEDLDANVDVSSAGVGDLDRDGFDDIAIVSPKAHEKAGQVTVVRGRDDIATVRTDSDEDVLMRIDGSAEHGITRVHRAGDVDGDGVDDLVVGAPDAQTPTRPERWTGMAWAVSGASRGAVEVGGDFDGFAIEGPAAGKNRFGMSVVNAGDVNADGFDDLLIGAPGSGIAGGAAVVLGSDSHDTVHTDPTAPGGLSVWSGDTPVLETGEPEAESAPEGEPTPDATEAPEETPQPEEDTRTERGWWFKDSDSGTANNFAFSVVADEAREDHVGTLVLSIFIKSRVVAVPSTILGDEPVIDLSAVAADEKLDLAEENATYLGRSMGIVDDFGEDVCPLLALGSRAEDRQGEVQLFALPWSDRATCEETTAPEPTEEPSETPTGEPSDGPSDEPGTDPSDAPTDDGSEHGDDGDGSGPGLPRTGTAIAGTLAVGLGLLGLGAALMIRARRRTA